MSETDLTKICTSIPVSAQGSVSTQAHNILLGLNGEDVEFNINTGSKPTLYGPSLTQSLNVVNIASTATSSKNGGFASSALMKIMLNDEVVYDGSILSSRVTSASDDGKVLSVVLHSSDFNDSTPVTVTLKYIDPTGSEWVFMLPTMTTSHPFAWSFGGISSGFRPYCILQDSVSYIGTESRIYFAVWDGSALYVSTSLKVAPYYQNANTVQMNQALWATNTHTPFMEGVFTNSVASVRAGIVSNGYWAGALGNPSWTDRFSGSATTTIKVYDDEDNVYTYNRTVTYSGSANVTNTFDYQDVSLWDVFPNFNVTGPCTLRVKATFNMSNMTLD